MDCGWKPNWEATRRRFVDWWNREGLVLGMWGAPPRPAPREAIAEPAPPADVAGRYTDVAWRTQGNHRRLAGGDFPADCLPLAGTDLGPGSLALFLGSEPGFAPHTVWFEPVWREEPDPERRPPLRFDPDNRWWRLTEALLRETVRLGRGRYAAGCPDLVENVDILAALREPEVLMMDLIERPEWVAARVWEINEVWFEAYNRIYDIIRLEDGSSMFSAFALWGPGRTAKVQCDESAMFSPDMFRRFVVPALTDQCARLDHSMYHLDGTQCIRHLDALLEIEPLDAIEWTPQAGIEPPGAPRWYELYRRILDAGKAVQVCGARPEEIIPLLDAIGGRGVYVMTSFASADEAEAMEARVEPYRKG